MEWDFNDESSRVPPKAARRPEQTVRETSAPPCAPPWVSYVAMVASLIAAVAAVGALYQSCPG